MKVQNRVLKVVLQAALKAPALLLGITAFSSAGAEKTNPASAGPPSREPPSDATPRSEPPRPLWRWPLEAEPPLSAWRVAAAHARARPFVNMHQAGLETLRRDLFSGRGRWFPFGRTPFSPAQTRFMNFGRGAFALAEVDATDTVTWAALIGTRMPIPFLEGAAFKSEEGLTRSNTFSIFAEALGQTRSHVLLGDATQVESSVLLAWSGGLQCLASGKGLARPLPGFMCDAPFEQRTRRAVSRDEPVAHSCQAMGSRRRGVLEAVRSAGAPNAVCFFQRSPADERYESSALETRLACFDGSTRKATFPAVPDAQALFPTSQASTFLVYEGRYSPPKVSLLNLNSPHGPTLQDAALAASPADGQQSIGTFASSERKGSLARIPEGFDSVYACQYHDVMGRDPSSEEWKREWYFVDTDIFEGRRALDTSHDRAFRVRVHAATRAGPDTLAIESMPWDSVPQRAPALDALPRLSCLLSPALDVKCGLKILRQGGQIAFEVLTGAWDETLAPEVRWGALGVLASALADVESRMPQWALIQETRAMKTFFYKRLEAVRTQLESQKGSTYDAWWQHESTPPARTREESTAAEKRLAGSEHDPFTRRQLLSTLGLPADLWERMKKNEPPPAETTTEDKAE
ncbi:MAG: hypothetical protein IOD12_04575 [Silvanigrellales bacterium]|nr:hypothetical protein [Silvanigrellales bacterium]